MDLRWSYAIPLKLNNMPENESMSRSVFLKMIDSKPEDSESIAHSPFTCRMVVVVAVGDFRLHRPTKVRCWSQHEAAGKAPAGRRTGHELELL